MHQSHGGSFAVQGLLVVVGLSLVPNVATAQKDLQALNAIEPYRIEGEAKGEVHVVGSGTMAGLAHICVESMKLFHPEIKVKTTAGGSEAGLSQLPKDLGCMASVTRPVEETDFQTLKSAGVKKPTAIIVGLDALAVFVHKNNPLKEASPSDLQRVFCDMPQGQRVDKWGQLGLTGAWAEKPVHLHIRGKSSGTRTFTDRYMLQGVAVRKDAKEHEESNADLLKAIESDDGAITVAPLYLKTEHTHPLSLKLGDQIVPANEASITQGAYRLVRPILWVFDAEGPAQATAINKQFLRFVLSREGQLDVIKAGYFPLNPTQIRQQQGALGVQMLR